MLCIRKKEIINALCEYSTPYSSLLKKHREEVHCHDNQKITKNVRKSKKMQMDNGNQKCEFVIILAQVGTQYMNT